MPYESRAVVLHRHRATWAAYWKQQRNYGRGYGQFFIRYEQRLPWTVLRELATWGRLSWMARGAWGLGDAALVRRGTLIKHLAQRVGFVETYYNAHERQKMRGASHRCVGEAAK